MISIDAPSTMSQFGWEKIGQEEPTLAVPVILRSDGVRYTPVRIVEQEIIRKYSTIPQSVFQCITLKSFFITPAEQKLLNNINFNHCNAKYGEEFFSGKDVIISVTDVKGLARFLAISFTVFNNEIARSASKLGIVKLNIYQNNATSLLMVPYLCKTYGGKTMKFVPSTMVEPYCLHNTNNVRAVPSDWDLIYLKMLCVFCDNNTLHLITKECNIVSLDGLLYKENQQRLDYEEYTSPTC